MALASEVFLVNLYHQVKTMISSIVGAAKENLIFPEKPIALERTSGYNESCQSKVLQVAFWLGWACGGRLFSSVLFSAEPDHSPAGSRCF